MVPTRAESRTTGQDDGELRCRGAAADAGGDAAPARQFCHVAQRDPTTTVASAKLMWALFVFVARVAHTIFEKKISHV